MVKQSTQQHHHQEDQPQNQEVNPLADERIGESLLLKSWNMALQVVNDAVQHNIKSGVKFPKRFTSAWYDPMEPMQIRKYKNWLKACVNAKTNTPYTLDSLIAAQILSESEREVFGELPLPRRELVSLWRIQVQNKTEYLVRTEKWIGLNKSGGVISISVDGTLDLTRRIQVHREFVPKDPQNPGGEQVLIHKVEDSNQWLTAPKIYLTLFSPDTVQQALKNAIPTTDSTLRGTSLILIRDGAPSPVGLTKNNNNIDSFVSRSFDELFEESLKPVGTNVTNININPKDLEAFLKYQQEHKQDDQYR